MEDRHGAAGEYQRDAAADHCPQWPTANQFEEVRKAYQGALVDHWAIVSWAHRADNTEAVDV
jgi:hypothetical protein